MMQLLLAALLACGALSVAQTPPNAPPEQEQRPRRDWGWAGRGTGGAIQSITADTLTLTTRDGGTATVKITPQTRFVRDGAPAKLGDFKVGDRVLVRGKSVADRVWEAEMVGAMRMGAQGPGGRGGPEMMERMREGLGKEFVAGEVVSIEGTKLTVHGPDGKDYTAEVNENTSFRKGRDSITFPEIKVGDRVMGHGKVNSAGEFVFENLHVAGAFGGTRQGPPPAPEK